MEGFVEDQRAKRSLETSIGRRVLGVECPVRNKTGDVCTSLIIVNFFQLSQMRLLIYLFP